MRFGRLSSDDAARADSRWLSHGLVGRPWLRGAVACAVLSVAVACAAWASASSSPQTVALAAAASASSSTSVPSSAVPTTGGSSTTISAPTSSLPASTTSTTFAVAAAAASPVEVCSAAKTYVDRLRRLSVSLTDPQRSRDLVLGASATSPAVTGAPPEVRNELAAVAGAIEAAKADLEAAGFAPEKLRPEVLRRLTGPEVIVAISRIEAWVMKSC